MKDSKSQLIPESGLRSLGYQAQKSDLLHISTHNLQENSSTYTFSEDTPLLYKINEILLRINDVGFIGLTFKREKRYYIHYEKTEEEKQLHVEKLSAGFHILFWGFLLGISSFLGELIISKLKKYRIRVTKIIPTKYKIKVVKTKQKKFVLKKGGAEST